MKSFPHFSVFDSEDIKCLFDSIDVDGSGAVTIVEFRKFIIRASPVNVSFLDRLRHLFSNANKHGTSEDEIFSYLDVDKDGFVTPEECKVQLKRLPHFENIEQNDIEQLLSILDQNGDGKVSLVEFRALLRQGQGQGQGQGLTTSSTGDNTTVKDAANVRNIFRREICRVAEADGGLVGLMAYLDKDEDGFISVETFFRLLSREGVYDVLGKSECESLLQPIISGTNINATLLLRLLEDAEFDPKLSLVTSVSNYFDTTGIDGADNIVDEYEFSTNLEVRQVEKKLRNIGRILSRAGTDVEGLFKKNDARNSGMIRKSDFIDILSKSGLYILEKGSTMYQEESNSTSERQKNQIQKFKSEPGKSIENSHKKVFIHDSKSQEEFQDHLESISLINWYRQGQKRMLLQRVLSHSLASNVSIFPR
jgi:Ca2+-binding EF-hand superfamily protein